MKRAATFFLLTLFIIKHSTGRAQSISTLNQNFDVACVLDSNFPSDWLRHNSINATIPDGQWSCTAERGRPRTDGVATPGVMCTGYYFGDFHVDTAYILLPMLNLTSYGDQRVYLQFDAKTSLVSNGSDLSAIISRFDIPEGSDTVVDHSAITPDLKAPTDTGWATYRMDITKYKSKNNFYLGFRYISTTGHGSVWYMDNMSLTSAPNNIPSVATNELPISVAGQPTRHEIAINYEGKTGANYTIDVYDMTGRVTRHEDIAAMNGVATYKITGLNLAGGMYYIRVSSGYRYGVVKAVVE